MCEKFEEFDVNFKIVSNKNDEIYVEGYVTINDEEAEDTDWYYWNGSGYSLQRVIWHDGVQITGATWEQGNEIAQFESALVDDDEWITDAILQSNDDENGTYVRKNITLLINDGAKMECEIKEDIQYRGDFVVEVIPKFNGEFIQLAKYMSQNGIDFDPWGCQDDTTVIEKGHIYFEMSKDYWDDDFKEEILAEVNEEARRIYARALTSELGIYAKYGDVMEQFMDDHYENEWLFKISQFLNRSDEELDAFLRKEGLIDEELE